VLFGYGQPNKRGFSGATSLGFDATLGFTICGGADRLQLGLLWLERRVSPLRPGVGPQRNQFRFNFALANIRRLIRKSPPPGKVVLTDGGRALHSTFSGSTVTVTVAVVRPYWLVAQENAVVVQRAGRLRWSTHRAACGRAMT
jgi:hypothetical protein